MWPWLTIWQKTAKPGASGWPTSVLLKLTVGWHVCGRFFPAMATQFEAVICDVSRPVEVAHALAADVVIRRSYRFNAELTEAAIAAGASFCDLGGHDRCAATACTACGR